MPNSPSSTIKKWLALILLVSVSGLALAQGSSSTSSEGWTPRDQDLRIFELRVKQYVLEDVIPAYQFQDITLLPLGAISELIDLAIEVNSETAQGFVLKEENSFALDTKRDVIELRGVVTQYDPDRVHVFLNEIFVDSNLLGEWLGMNFNVDLFGSRVWIESSQPLPFIQRKERNQRIKRALRQMQQQQKQYPSYHEPYQYSGDPFVDQSLRYNWQDSSESGSASGYQYTTYATADLFHHETSLYFTGNNVDFFDSERLTFSRKQSTGGLLGPLDLTEYSFGHVTEPRLALINQPGSLEPGVSVSNFPLSRQLEFDRHRFIGELPASWEVELYRNSVLIAYQAEPIDGQYDFQDVPLLFGKNHFRFVFYGPQGQIRTEDEYFDLDQSLIRQGQQYYRISMTNDELEGHRGVLQLDRGLTNQISANASLVSIPLELGGQTQQHHYLSVGLRGYWDNFFATANLINDSGSGSAAQLTLQTRLGSSILKFSETQLNQFFSEEFESTVSRLTDRSELRLDTAIPSGFLPRMPVSFELKRDRFADGNETNSFTNTISVNARGMAISNQLTYQELASQDSIASGNLQISSRLGDVRLRGNLTYLIRPNQDLDSLQLTVDPSNLGDYRLSFSLSHSLQNDLSEISVSTNKATNRYNLSLGARYNTENALALDATVSFSFGRKPRRAQWFANSRAMAGSGSVSTRVFLDHNQDGIFNSNDEPVADVGFRLNGGLNYERTDENGIAFLIGLPTHQPTVLQIAPETIADPSWHSAIEGVMIEPRSGRSIMLELPIHASGEIDGTVLISQGSRQFGAGRITVELVDSENNVVQTTSTAYDGFYIFSSVPFGHYLLRVAKESQSDQGFIADSTKPVSVTEAQQFRSGVNLVLRATTE